MVRMRLPTESEPAITLEKVHAVTALPVQRSICAGREDQGALFLPGRYLGVILLKLDISGQEIFARAIFVRSSLTVAIGHDLLLFSNNLTHETEYA